MPVARDVEIITICNSQALPRFFIFFFFFKAMSDPVLGIKDREGNKTNPFSCS